MKNLTILGIVLVPFVLLLSSFAVLVYNPGFHAKLLDDYSLKPEIGKQIDKQLIDYFRSDSKKPPEIKEFTEEENQHMLDVKVRINQVLRLWLILSGFFLGVLYFSNEKRRIFLYGGPLTVIPFLIYELVPFDAMFDRMHWALFERGTWLFPPDLMIIQVFTIDFFFWFTCGFATTALALGLGSSFLAWVSKH